MPARSRSPNGSSRRSSSGPASSPETSAVRTSPARRRSVSSAIRRRSSSSATIVTAWCSVSRSNSDSCPLSLAATSHACGALSSPPVARATGSASERPSSSPPGANPRRAPARTRSRSSAPSAASAWRSAPRDASRSPRPSKIIAGPPISEASAPATPSSPCSESTTRSRRSWAASARRRSAYWSLTSELKARSVRAMNGSSYGTSNSGKPCSSAASTSASGQRVELEAGAEAEAGEPVAGEPARRTRAAGRRPGAASRS